MKDFADIPGLMADIGTRAKTAATALATARAEQKRAALIAAADHVWAERRAIIEANAKDMEFGAQKGLSDAMMDRLRLDEDRIRGIVDGLRAVAEQADPVGEVIADWTQPTGLHIQKMYDKHRPSQLLQVAANQ